MADTAPPWKRESACLILLLAAECLASGCAARPSHELSSANQLLIEAQGLAAEGKTEEAIEKFGASIQADPTVWAYRGRAKLRAEKGDDAEARSDCEEALKLVPDDADALWIKNELGKPLERRFQGDFKVAPSSHR